MIDYHDDPRWRAAWTCEGCHELFFDDGKTFPVMKPKVLNGDIYLCERCYNRSKPDEREEL